MEDRKCWREMTRRTYFLGAETPEAHHYFGFCYPASLVELERFAGSPDKPSDRRDFWSRFALNMPRGERILRTRGTTEK